MKLIPLQEMLLNHHVYDTISTTVHHQRWSRGFCNQWLSLLTWRAPVTSWSYCTYMLLVRHSV